MSATGEYGVGIFDAQVLDLMAKIADDVLESHDDLVSVRQLLLQPRENRVAQLIRSYRRLAPAH